MKIKTVQEVRLDTLPPEKQEFCCESLATLVINNPSMFSFDIDRSTRTAYLVMIISNPWEQPMLGRGFPTGLRRIPYNFCQFCGEKVT